jgi:hypothetical protein
LPAAGGPTGSGLYWRDLVLLIGAIVATLGIAFMCAANSREARRK